MFLYLTVTLLFLLYYITTRKYNYWKDRNVPHKTPTILLGNYGKVLLQKKSLGETIRDYCNEFPNEKFIGAFHGTEPVLIPKDPEIIKLIVTKDFAYFNGRLISEHSDKEPLGLNLFATHGDNWRVLRQNMSPMFSSAKLKNMFHLINKCSLRFEEMLDRETNISKDLEVRSLTARYTMECVGACAFGVDTNTMTEEEKDNPFRKIAAFTNPPKVIALLFQIRLIWPTIFYLFGGNLANKQILFFHNLINSVMTRREYKHSGRNDFVDLVMGWKTRKQIVGESIKNTKTGEVRKLTLEATDDLLISQCFVFFNAGFETSSTTLSYTLYELAKHKEIQDKVLEEVDAYVARHENKLNFDCISDLPYLDAVIDEALRYYPVLGMIPRELMEDYTMPGGAKLSKGMRVHLPVYYLHHNPEFYPEPEIFRPERFLGEEKQKINPYVYLPFGEGPRLCIGTVTHGRELSEHSHKEPLASNLFGTYGDTWRVLRQNMTPLFSSAKMKNMFHLIEKCSHVFESMLDRETKISKELEVRSLTSRYTMECIGACAFGVDTNTMTEEENDNPFRKMADFMDPPKYVVYMRVIRTIWPSIFYLFGFQLLKTQLQFFGNLITSVMTQREYKSSGRHDFVDLIMSWKQTHQIVGDSMKNIKTGENRKVTLEANDDLLVAQCFIFFAAGFETSSTTLSYTLYELAKNNDIQDKVLEEVDAYLARHENKLNYDCISDLPYLDAVIDEALRFYPVLGMIPRELMEDYTMPGGAKLDKGMRVHLPVYYLHHNPEFYPEPEVFRPERFLGEEKRNINPYVYLPFGEGPRTCIGMRFAKMQMLAGLITILKKYRLELADGMPTKLTFKPQSFITHPVGGIRLKFVEREGWETRVFVK